MPALDPTSPVPLYHQIAEDLRRRIDAGELLPGQTLEPLREAAARFGVNVHTVRHAYAELAREGRIESLRRRGTRVRPVRGRGAGTPTAPPLPGELAAACRASGLGPEALLERLGRHLEARRRGGPPRALVLECSRSQCLDLAGQLAGRFDVEAVPWPLDTPGDPEEGTLVGTYFHYNEIRRRWPLRLGEVRFLAIHPDPGLPERLEAHPASRPGAADGARTVLVAETDEPTLEAVVADLAPLLPAAEWALRPLRVAGPEDLAGVPGSEPLLLSPRLWGRLDPAERAHPRFLELRYVFDEDDLARLAEDPAFPLRRSPRIHERVI